MKLKELAKIFRLTATETFWFYHCDLSGKLPLNTFRCNLYFQVTTQKMFTPIPCCVEECTLEVFAFADVGFEDLTVFLGLLSFSHTLSLYFTFLIFFFSTPSFSLPPSFPHFNIWVSTPSLGSGKMSRTKHVGVWESFGTGRRSLCGVASWTYKEMGAGEVEKGVAMQGQGGVSRKLRALHFRNCGGGGVCSSGRSYIQMHSSRTSGLLFTSSATSPSVCDMDTVAALPGSHNTENPLRISRKVGALIPKECDSVHVKSSGW